MTKSEIKQDYTELLPETVLDSEGYPTIEFLECIREFSPLKHQLMGFLNIIFENWMHGNYGYKIKKSRAGYRTMEFHTLGWSGNEEIIRVLEENVYFFMLYWKKSERGGHYWFLLPVDYFVN